MNCRKERIYQKNVLSKKKNRLKKTGGFIKLKNIY
jgi:hypothetical protein